MSSDNNASNKTVRVVNVNAYMNSNAKFNWGLYFASYATVWFSVFTTLLFIINFIETMDYLKALSNVENTLMVFVKYVATFSLGNLNNLNHLNDFIGINVFNFNVELQSPNINTEGWILIGITSIISFFGISTPIYQLYIQRMLKKAGFPNYYSPQLLLHKFWNRHKTKRLYLRLLPEVNVQNITKTNGESIMKNFFGIKASEVKNYELEVNPKMYFTFFDYFTVDLVKKDSKKKELLLDEKETVSKDQSYTEQSQKISSNSTEPKKFHS